MSFSSKKNSFSSTYKNEQSSNPQSQGDTFFDSMHNSKFSEGTKNKNKNQKANNFYLALNCVLTPIQESILLGTSEFSEFNPNQTKDENISRYLHHPVIKEINKEGNNLIRIQPKQNYDTIGKHPYIAKYNNMKKIFSEMILSLKGINNYENNPGRRTLNYNINYNNNFNLNINNKYNTIHRRNFNKEINLFQINNNNLNELKIEHQKNKSSITNNIYNNITNNKDINTKNKTTKIKSQINSTTITKDNLNKKNKPEEKDVQDIKMIIKYEDNLEDLEEPKDIDLKNYIDDENKDIFLNDYNSNISSLNSKKKINIINNNENEEMFINKKNTNSKTSKQDEILIYDSLVNNNMNISNNNNNLNISKVREKRTTTIKKLRKKYERTEFKRYSLNTNPHINRYSYVNKGKDNLELDIYDSRKKTLELNKKLFGSLDLDKIMSNKIYYTTQKSNQFENNILYSESKNDNINKNLLENFNDCGNSENNDGINSNNKIKEKIDLNINNGEKNKINNNPDRINNSPEAEFLDFISNKSETVIKNNSSSKNNKESIQNNTFIIKDTSNKIETIKDVKQNNNNTYIKINSPKSEKISIRKYTSSMSHSCYEENNNNNTYNINDNKNCLYDFVSPDRNPDALIRRNFSLMSSFENDESENSFLDELKYDYHSCRNRMKHNKFNEEFSLNNGSNQSEFNNSNILLNDSFRKRNKLYLIKNKENLKESLINQVPETVYDLTFYQNLIENSKKVRKINYKNIIKNQKKIKWKDRLHTLCWMMETCEEFAFKRDTYHYACNYFDNYLAFSKEKIKNEKVLDLIGITCISISGKIEEVQIPKLKEYANSIDNMFGIKDIIEMEQKICLTLGWKLINTNINTWLNWYICQWDLYIDSIDDIKEKLLKYIKEEEIIYYKKSVDSSYYNYRKICQLIDLIILDYYSYNFDSRVLMAVCLLVIICINYNLDYNFKKKNFKQKTEFSQYIFDVYIQFINQSFDFNFSDKNIQKALEYVYKFKNFKFTYELPLIYQIHPEMLEYGNYEDFISYQATNDNFEDYMMDIYSKRNLKNSSEKTTTYTDKNKFFPSHKSSMK